LCGTLLNMQRSGGKVHKGFYLLAPILILTALIVPMSVQARAASDPGLGAAGDFQIVSGAATTLGATLVGLDPVNVSSAVTAVNDLRSAITSLSSAPATAVAADFGGKTYEPGVYVAAGGAAVAMTSGVILDGKNDCNSVFIFSTPAAMNTTAGISITLINGAKPGNVYWVAGGAITTGASGHLVGNFMSAAAITVGASSSINGRFLGLAAVTIGASVNFLGFPVEKCAAAVGALLISVPKSMAPRELNAGETVTMEMGPVVVTDTRGITAGALWSVSATSAGVRDSAGNVLGGEHFSYAMREVNKTGGLILLPHTLNSMSLLSVILNATSGEGVNSATWIPIITVAVPADQASGTYIGTIVHSVS
jgi:hypothetical protein